MVNKELLLAIQQKKKTTRQAIYLALQQVRKRHQNLISKEEAAFIFAIENKIDVHKYLKSDPALHQRILDLIRNQPQVVSIVKKIKKDSSNSQIQKVLKLKTTTINDVLLPTRILEDAKRMSEIYPLIYVFENSVRNFIKLALDKAFPNGWWCIERITRRPYDNANSRRLDEGKNLWHGKRGQSSMLDYLDLDELEAVINNNTQTLTPYLKGLPKDLGWLQMKIKEIYPSRNVLAHNNPLSKDDIARVKINCNDWNKQLPLLKQKLKQ